MVSEVSLMTVIVMRWLSYHNSSVLLTGHPWLLVWHSWLVVWHPWLIVGHPWLAVGHPWLAVGHPDDHHWLLLVDHPWLLLVDHPRLLLVNHPWLLLVDHPWLLLLLVRRRGLFLGRNFFLVHRGRIAPGVADDSHFK